MRMTKEDLSAIIFLRTHGYFYERVVVSRETRKFFCIPIGGFFACSWDSIVIRKMNVRFVEYTSVPRSSWCCGISNRCPLVGQPAHEESWTAPWGRRGLFNELNHRAFVDRASTIEPLPFALRATQQVCRLMMHDVYQLLLL